MMKKNLNNHKIDYYYYKNDISKQEEKKLEKNRDGMRNEKGGLILFLMMLHFGRCLLVS